VQQAEDFKRILKEEKESFERVNQDLQAQFSSQLKEIPMLEKKLADVAEIPQKIDEMIARLEQSNSQLYSNFLLSTRETLVQFAKASKEHGATGIAELESKQPKTSRIVIVCAVLIAIACIANTVHNIWFIDNQKQEPVVEQQYNDYQDSRAVEPIAIDTTAVDSIVEY
jgi:predicted nuclease with TOPRIM domain